MASAGVWSLQGPSRAEGVSVVKIHFPGHPRAPRGEERPGENKEPPMGVWKERYTTALIMAFLWPLALASLAFWLVAMVWQLLMKEEK